MTTTTITRDNQQPLIVQHDVPFEDMVTSSESGGFRALSYFQSSVTGDKAYQGWKWDDAQSKHILVTHVQKEVK